MTPGQMTPGQMEIGQKDHPLMVGLDVQASLFASLRLRAPGEGVGWDSVSSGAMCSRSTTPPSNACLLSSARPIGSRPGRLGVGSFASSASVVPHWACRDWDRVQVVGLKRGLRSISALATVWSGQVMSTDAPLALTFSALLACLRGCVEWGSGPQARAASVTGPLPIGT